MTGPKNLTVHVNPAHKYHKTKPLKPHGNPAQGHPTPGSGIITAYGSDSDPEDRDDDEEQPDYLPGPADHRHVAVPAPVMMVEQGISAWSEQVESMLNNVAIATGDGDAREESQAPSPHGGF